MRHGFALVLAAIVSAQPLMAQGVPATAELRALHALRDLETLELGLAARRDTGNVKAQVEQQRLLGVTRAILDTAILQRPDGRRTLTALRRQYPGASLLAEYDGWRLLADADPTAGLAVFDALLRRERRSMSLLRGRARALDALHRTDDATAAWQRILDNDPSDADAFNALRRIHEADHTLPVFRATIARLRLLHPADTVLVGREVQLLQQLGQPDSAAAVAQKFAGGGT